MRTLLVFSVALILAAPATAQPKKKGKHATTTEAIEKALASSSGAEFVDVELNRALEYLGDRHNVTILPDRPEWAAMKIKGDEPVTMKLSGISFGEILRHLLTPLKLTYTVRDGALIITSPVAAEMPEHFTRTVYDVTDLTNVDPRTGLSNISSIAELIKSQTAAGWADLGGGGGVMNTLSVNKGQMLVVRCSWKTHTEIAEILDKVRGAAKKHSGSKKGR